MSWLDFIKGSPKIKALNLNIKRPIADLQVSNTSINEHSSWFNTILNLSEIFTLEGGIPPYTVNCEIMGWENMPNYKERDFKLLNLDSKNRVKLNGNIKFEDSTLPTVILSVYSVDILMNIKDKKQLFTAKIYISDSRKETISQQITLNFKALYDGIKSQESVTRPDSGEIKYYNTEDNNTKIKLVIKPEINFKRILGGQITFNIYFEDNIIDPFNSQVDYRENYIQDIPIVISNESKLLGFKKENITVTLLIDFVTQIHTVTFTIPTFEVKNHYLMLKNPLEFTLKDLCIIRVDKKEFFSRAVKSRLLGPKVLYGSPERPTVHFTLNHAVKGHSRATWNDSDWAMVVPFVDFYNKNARNFCGGSSVDLFTMGYAQIPTSTIFLERKDQENWREFTERINQEILKMGFKVMQGGDYNWADINGKDESELLKRISKNSWPTYHNHTYSDFSRADEIGTKIAQENWKGKQLRIEIEAARIRKEIINTYQNKYPQIYNTFKNQLNAWNSFWNRVHNIKKEDLK